VAILLMAIGGYSINGYWWLFYYWLIGDYSINGLLVATIKVGCNLHLNMAKV